MSRHGSAIVAQVDGSASFDVLIPTSNAGAEPESYQVAAYDCVDDDGSPNPAGAGDCVRTVFLTANQIPCADRAQLLGFTLRHGWRRRDTSHNTEKMAVYGSALTRWTELCNRWCIRASLTASVDYRVLAKGGEFQTAASNVVGVS